jgi:hypothetical protein
MSIYSTFQYFIGPALWSIIFSVNEMLSNKIFVQ